MNMYIEVFSTLFLYAVLAVFFFGGMLAHAMIPLFIIWPILYVIHKVKPVVEETKNLHYSMMVCFCLALGVPGGFNTVQFIKSVKEERKATTESVMSSELGRYILVDYNPPKQFYVTLKNVKTGQVYDHVYVSKHCNNHHSLKKGDEFNIQTQQIKTVSPKYGESISTRFLNLYNTFC